MEKKTYETAEMEVINIVPEEIVTSSSIETPIVPSTGIQSDYASRNIFP